MTRATRYLAWNYLLGCVPVLLILVTLFSFLALSEELENVGKGLYQTRDALTVMLLTTPGRLLELLPVTLLLGSLWGLGALARHGEIIALRAAGLSVVQLAVPVLAVALMAVALVLILRFQFIPGFEREAQALRAKMESTGFLSSEDAGGFWMRAGDKIVRLGGLQGSDELSDIEVYQLNEHSQIEHFMRAASGRMQVNGEWQLRAVRRYDASDGPAIETLEDSVSWRSPLTETQASSIVVPVEALSPLSLYRYINLLETNRIDSHRHRIIFWQQLSQLPAMIIMAILSVPFILGTQRSGALARSAVIGGGLGIGFYLAEQLVSHLSVLVDLAPPLAATLPELGMAGIAALLLRRARGF
ncbi:MAG: LPS export ABC transporter permease LptG [Chromatocurvus sp.]